MVIQDIQEVSQYIELKFEVSLQWKDARILFYNIKQDEEMNTLTMDEQVSLWTPTLVFWNTKHQLRTINDKGSIRNKKCHKKWKKSTIVLTPPSPRKF